MGIFVACTMSDDAEKARIQYAYVCAAHKRLGVLTRFNEKFRNSCFARRVIRQIINNLQFVSGTE